jgi:hypothetical protein
MIMVSHVSAWVWIRLAFDDPLVYLKSLLTARMIARIVVCENKTFIWLFR